jgi:hypothetical protein
MGQTRNVCIKKSTNMGKCQRSHTRGGINKSIGLSHRVMNQPSFYLHNKSLLSAFLSCLRFFAIDFNFFSARRNIRIHFHIFFCF